MKKCGIALFLMLQAGDVASTMLLYYLYKTPLIESNPFTRIILEYAGGGGLVGVKAFGTGIIAVCWLKLPIPWQNPMLGFANLMMSAIVAWNISLSLKAF